MGTSMVTATRIAGAAALALALSGVGSTAFAAADDAPPVSAESGAGGAGGAGTVGLNVLCGINGTCTAGQGGEAGESSATNTIGESS